MVGIVLVCLLVAVAVALKLRRGSFFSWRKNDER
jgi:hypothetical protein